VLLSVSNLFVNYGAIGALHDVSLEVEPGEIVTLIGSNGAGKTTLLRALSGLVRPRTGTIHFRPADGQSATGNRQSAIHTLAPHEIVRLGLSHVPEGRQVFPQHTVRENLILGAYQQPDRGVIQSDLARIFSLFPILAERREQKAGTLSGGEQQMLAIGRAMMAHPKLLLLDEPSLGLAPLIVRKIFDIIREINREGTTIFLVEQNAHMALAIAHRAYVLQTGQVLKTGPARELLNDPEVKAAYLGG
jgi:branched-chain amino acid transport system ATP-binding protein